MCYTKSEQDFGNFVRFYAHGHTKKIDRKGKTMGIFLNPGKEGFQEAVRSRIYIDKTELLHYTNRVLGTMQKYICVSRPRRFGKSITAEMVSAYYGKNCDSYDVFEGLRIAKHSGYKEYMNKFDVVHLDINTFICMKNPKTGLRIDALDTVVKLQQCVIKELKSAFKGCFDENETNLPQVLAQINDKTGNKFIIVIDEWDALFREYKEDKAAQESYIDLMRGLFKNKLSVKFIALAYITGILPIKKYGTESALNNFDEYTMLNPGELAEYVGFTEHEAKGLCKQYNMDYAECKHWYDGYVFAGQKHIYNPRSVVEAISRKKFEGYWTNTETYESLKGYITANFDGLKDMAIELLTGKKIAADVSTFQNDMSNMQCADDVLALLVHLGYLAYDAECEEVYIPNEEIRKEFARTIKNTSWLEAANAIKHSKKLLEATWDMDSEYVSKALEEVHSEEVSILQYNDENSLSCVVSLAYYAAREYYTMFRELPRGKGFADIVCLPNKNIDKPALVIELKWDKSTEGAIAQIKRQNYTENLKNLSGNLLLIGINYDKKTKKHECTIEKWQKKDKM